MMPGRIQCPGWSMMWADVARLAAIMPTIG
jgi:hypothetical protein